MLGGFVPDATETVEFQRKILNRHGSIYYLNYSRNGFCLNMFSAQLADLLEDLARKGQKPLIMGVSFGCGLLAGFLRKASVQMHESIRGLILVSPVLTTDDLIRPPGQQRDGVRIHGGTSMKPYLNEFENLFDGRLPQLLELLPSSEAFMAFQLPGETRMRLTPYYGVFFEFVRFEDLDGQGQPAPYADAIPLDQVETGQRYAIILSTCSGLWRYHIGDTIRFVSTAPYLIEFTGRDRFLDTMEEKVTQGEVEQAVANLNRNGRWKVREFMVGADVSKRRHQWVLAVRESGPSASEAARLLDATLCELNADYAAFRGQGRINPPDVLLAPEDGIYRWSQLERGKLGGQSKIPHIDPTPDSAMIASLRSFHGQSNRLQPDLTGVFNETKPIESVVAA